MKNATIICMRWKYTGRIEAFTNLGKLYKKYDEDILGVSVHTLRKKKLYSGWENDMIEVYKIKMKNK